MQIIQRDKKKLVDENVSFKKKIEELNRIIEVLKKELKKKFKQELKDIEENIKAKNKILIDAVETKNANLEKLTEELKTKNSDLERLNEELKTANKNYVAALGGPDLAEVIPNPLFSQNSEMRFRQKSYRLNFKKTKI